MVDKTGFPNSSHNATIEILIAWGFYWFNYSYYTIY